MTPLVQTVTDFLSVITLMGIGGIIVLVAAIAVKACGGRGYALNFIFKTIDRYAIAFGFFISSGAVAASLFYSEIAGFHPCPLCWWQRIFMYPQTVLFGVAFFKKNTALLYPSIIMSAIGAIIATYHTYIQFGGSSLFECSAANLCTQRYFVEFGFVTIPTMALTSFLLLLVIMTAKIMARPEDGK